jgi:hypothetical protein
MILMPPAAVIISSTHHATFISMGAAGRRAGRASAATEWRLEKAEIACVILQGSLQSLCKALQGRAVSCCVVRCDRPLFVVILM